MPLTMKTYIINNDTTAHLNVFKLIAEDHLAEIKDYYTKLLSLGL